ncbi:hypothetical protein APHAL10511_000661 [Amanita phalloides]|nr:hypothetical protein APHAL10511_000661 [Amanita phalloides]
MYTHHHCCSIPHPAGSSRLSTGSYPAVPTVIDDKTPVWFHEVLDSTTQEVGFNYTCLEGLTPDLLYSPTDAFAQSCWEILFPGPPEPELELESEPHSPISSFPPSYTTLPEFYAHSTGSSSSRSTIRKPEQEDKLDEPSFIDYKSGDYFWDDNDDDDDDGFEDDGYDGELDNVTSFDDETSDIASSFSHSDAIRNHPIIDTDSAVKEDLFLHDLSPVDWKSSLMCWEDSLPISVVFREMPVNNKVRKPSRLSAWKDKIPILPFRSTRVHNSWS